MPDKTTLLERIRPKELDLKQERLHLEDIKVLRKKYPNLIKINCVACGFSKYSIAYKKLGFTYNRCDNCDTLFISPRLSKEGLSYFFSYAKSMQFRAKEFYISVENERLEKILIPRWELIKNVLTDLGASFPLDNVLEIGASVGTFASILINRKEVINYDAIEPSKSVSKKLKEIGIRNVYIGMEDDFVEDIHSIYDIVFCNGVLEHPFSPVDFLSNLKALLNANGVIVICSPGGSGVDSSLLGPNQPNALPPHMQNFISNKGMKLLASRCGLKLIHFQSIGQLDMAIIFDYLISKKEKYYKKVRHLLENRILRNDLQEVLRKNSMTGFYLALLEIR